MTSSWAFRIGAFVLQLAPLAVIAFWLYFLSKPDESSMPGVMAYRPLGLWYVYPYSILLAIVGLGAIFSRVMAVAATIATLGAVAYGIRLFFPGGDPQLGTWLIAAALLSITGGILREWRAGASPEPRVPRSQVILWVLRIVAAIAVTVLTLMFVFVRL
jgi:hypothetical protein